MCSVVDRRNRRNGGGGSSRASCLRVNIQAQKPKEEQRIKINDKWVKPNKQGYGVGDDGQLGVKSRNSGNHAYGGLTAGKGIQGPNLDVYHFYHPVLGCTWFKSERKKEVPGSKKRLLQIALKTRGIEKRGTIWFEGPNLLPRDRRGDQSGTKYFRLDGIRMGTKTLAHQDMAGRETGTDRVR